MYHRMAIAFAALITSFGICAAAAAQERFALVIGNSAYQSVTALPNPQRDAEAVGDLLEAAGFAVSTALDLGRSDMHRTVRAFADGLADADEDTVVLVYFAGHGLQIDGENYLLPVDVSIRREADVPLEGIGLGDIVNMLESVPGSTRIVVLDACRNNPFAEIGEDIGEGLAIVHAPPGSMIAYSTSPGSTAEDGTGTNSPFTASLVEAARVPGTPIETVFQNVRLDVHKVTDGRQTPWEVTALTEPFAFFGAVDGEAHQTQSEMDEEQWREELTELSAEDAYEVVILQDNAIVYEIYVTLFADTPWGGRIRGLMERRLEMLAWLEAVTHNSVAAFAAFLKRYPDSDLAATARRLKERTERRLALAETSPDPLGVAAGGEPEIRTVIQEVRVPSPPEIRTVTKEVVKEVKVPVVREVVKEVKVPVVREVVKEVKVPVVREVIKEVKVPVQRPCRCNAPSVRPGGGRPSAGPGRRPGPRSFHQRRSRR